MFLSSWYCKMFSRLGWLVTAVTLHKWDKVYSHRWVEDHWDIPIFKVQVGTYDRTCWRSPAARVSIPFGLPQPFCWMRLEVWFGGSVACSIIDSSEEALAIPPNHKGSRAVSWSQAFYSNRLFSFYLATWFDVIVTLPLYLHTSSMVGPGNHWISTCEVVYRYE